MAEQVQENDRRARYVVTDPAGQSVFDIDFPLEQSSDLILYLNGDAVSDLAYVVDLQALSVSLNTPAPEGSIVTLEGARQVKRVNGYPLRGDLDSRRINYDMNSIIQMLQEMRRDIDRSIIFNKAEANASSNIMPLFVPNKAVVINAAGNGIALSQSDIADLDSAVEDVNALVEQVEGYRDEAAVSAQDAQDAAEKMFGTSASAAVIGVGEKVFITQTGKFFMPGQFILVAVASDVTNWMHGQVVSYVDDDLVLNVTSVGGTGGFDNWVLHVSGARGVKGDTGSAGAPGSGTGDVVGPASVVDARIALFDGTSGDLLKAAGGGYGTMASQNSNGVNISGGSISGIADLAIADGGTGASDAAGARTNIGANNASNLNTGTVAPARLGTGTANSDTYLRGNSTWGPFVPPSAFGAVGTYAFAICNTSSVATGATVSGEHLNAVSLKTDGSLVSGGMLSGTWRNMGGAIAIEQGRASLWMRVS